MVLSWARLIFEAATISMALVTLAVLWTLLMRRRISRMVASGPHPLNPPLPEGRGGEYWFAIFQIELKKNPCHILHIVYGFSNGVALSMASLKNRTNSKVASFFQRFDVYR